MAEYTFEGKGNTLDDAMDDMYVTIHGAAVKRNYFKLPAQEDLGDYAIGYTVGVRTTGKSFVNGDSNVNLDQAYQSALHHAEIRTYDPLVHRLKVVGKYNLEEDQEAKSVEKGRPSGAGPSVSRARSLTDLM